MTLSLIEQDEQVRTRQLADCEARIERGLKTFYEVGEALLRIRDQGLYKEAAFSTFEDYCRERWGMSRPRAYQMIEAAEVAANLSTFVDVLPQNEAQTRPLAPLLPVEQQQVWQDVLEETGGNGITAEKVQVAVQSHMDKKQEAAADLELIAPKPEPAQPRLPSPTLLLPPLDTRGLYIPPPDELEQVRAASKVTFNEQKNDNIEWARWSWNPVTGCKHDCAYCYARDIAARFYPQGFEPTFIPERLAAPRNTKAPDLSKFENPVDKIGWRNVFVCSMADLWGKWVPREIIDCVLREVRENAQWTYLFLTKFPARYPEFEFPENTWVGTTVDRQFAVHRAEKAFQELMEAGHQGVRWLSVEPMMERLKFTSLSMFDWVVIGGSSRSTQTPEFMPPFDWIVDLYGQAREAGCKVYFKTNLGIHDAIRVREYPGMDSEE